MQTGGSGRSAGYPDGVRRLLAGTLWIAAVVLHAPARAWFLAEVADWTTATLAHARWLGGGVVVAGSLLAARSGWKGPVVGLVAAALVLAGHTSGEALHVVQYAAYAWIGGPPAAWVVAAVADEAWEASAGSPFDLADVALDAAGVLLVVWARRPRGAARRPDQGKSAMRIDTRS